MHDLKVCVLGTDDRSKFLRKSYLEECGKLNSFENADVIIGPTPFSKDDVKVNGEVLSCDELIKSLENSSKVLYAGAISNNMKNKLKKAIEMEEYELAAILRDKIKIIKGEFYNNEKLDV